MPTAAELKMRAGRKAQQNFWGAFQALMGRIDKANMAAQATKTKKNKRTK